MSTFCTVKSRIKVLRNWWRSSLFCENLIFFSLKTLTSELSDLWNESKALFLRSCKQYFSRFSMHLQKSDFLLEVYKVHQPRFYFQQLPTQYLMSFNYLLDYPIFNWSASTRNLSGDTNGSVSDLCIWELTGCTIQKSIMTNQSLL